MHALANGITSFFIDRGLLDEEHREFFLNNREWYLRSVREPSLALVEALAPEYELWRLQRELSLLRVDAEVLDRPFCTLSNGEQTKVLLAAMFLRQRAGGWHAPTAWLCQIISVGSALLGSFAAAWCAGHRPWLSMGALLAASGLVIWLLAPAEHPNLPLTPAELAANRRLARQRLALAAIAAVLLQTLFPFRPEGLCAAAGVLLAAVGVLAQTIQQEVMEHAKL